MIQVWNPPKEHQKGPIKVVFHRDGSIVTNQGTTRRVPLSLWGFQQISMSKRNSQQDGLLKSEGLTLIQEEYD